MKKVLILFTAIALTLTLTACAGECEPVEVEKIVEVEVPAELPEIPAVVDMSNVDDFLGRPDVQYVDLRNFDDKMNGGYIAGFEFIPFFQYLENEDILSRTNSWTFEAAGIGNQAQLENLFDADKEAIFLMCGSGTRAGFVLDALVSIGYDNVINVGGISAYSGDNKVLGDGTFALPQGLAAIPAVVDMANVDSFLGRPDVQYVDLRNFDDKLNGGYIAGFEFIPFFDYLEHEEVLVRTNGWTFEAAGIMNQVQLENLFDKDAGAIFLMCGSGTRAGFVKDALESIGYTNVINVGGISSYSGDNKVLGDGTFMLDHPAMGDFTPGIYIGHSGGYVAVITVGAGGAIENVMLDAAHFSYGTTEFLSMKRAYTTPEEYSMNYQTNDNGTPLDDSDDFLELVEGKLDWWMQADALQAAVLANQGWDDAWTLVDGAFGADEVAGVSIGVESWMEAIDDAVAQATPAS